MAGPTPAMLSRPTLAAGSAPTSCSTTSLPSDTGPTTAVCPPAPQPPPRSTTGPPGPAARSVSVSSLGGLIPPPTIQRGPHGGAAMAQGVFEGSGFGLVTSWKLVPSNHSTSVVWLPEGMMAEPATSTSSGPRTLTPKRRSWLFTSMVGTMTHAEPVQRSARVFSLPDEPTANTVPEASAETERSRVSPPPGGEGTVTCVHFEP